MKKYINFQSESHNNLSKYIPANGISELKKWSHEPEYVLKHNNMVIYWNYKHSSKLKTIFCYFGNKISCPSDEI